MIYFSDKRKRAENPVVKFCEKLQFIFLTVGFGLAAVLIVHHL